MQGRRWVPIEVFLKKDYLIAAKELLRYLAETCSIFVLYEADIAAVRRSGSNRMECHNCGGNGHSFRDCVSPSAFFVCSISNFIGFYYLRKGNALSSSGMHRLTDRGLSFELYTLTLVGLYWIIGSS